MAELNLKQITDKLNEEFTGEVRKLVFWYDDNADFIDDIDTLELQNAKILHLEKDNQFFVKYHLECVDKETNYLIYAPFAKPEIRDNHLADIIFYSKEFHADRASLLAIDLGIEEKYKPTIEKYIKFFANKERTQKFYDLEIESFNEEVIELALMSVLCKCRAVAFEEVLRAILTDDEFKNNKYIAEIEKYELLNAFWTQAEKNFGYSDPKPTLEKLVITIFITSLSETVHSALPTAWNNFVSYKSGSITAFNDNLMNSYLYADRYDEISHEVYKALNAESVLGKMKVEDIADSYVFAGIDSIIIDWIISRLENEDIGAKLNGKSIPQICADRRKRHFGNKFKCEYFVLENAYYIISDCKYKFVNGIGNILKKYTEETFAIDRRYRYFYFYFDKLLNTANFENLRDLVENIYTNEYLNKITANWSKELASADFETGISKQHSFYSKYIKTSADRVVVIVSDALRYEVAHTLFEKMKADEKCKVSIEAMQGVLPSYTPLGMASLLPHEQIEYNDKFEVLVDKNLCASTEQREAILKKYNQNSCCVRFDELKTMKQAELRALFTGKQVIYVYHNQVDARGDDAKTENEVFTACEEAINEIYDFIKRVASQANTYHFMVTSDHGFIYKRDKIEASDKISSIKANGTSIGQRYLLAEEGIDQVGTEKVSIGKILNNNDQRFISFPIASDIFKVAGSGQNYVHGGCSPQEMIVPVIDVKVDKNRVETTTAKISLVSLSNKITNLITSLDFVQTEPVSSMVKETVYRIYFVSEENEKISNENICIADKKDTDTLKRMFRFKFTFKDKQYNRGQKYYLVAYDDKNDIEVLRHEILIDIAFANDFGFDI